MGWPAAARFNKKVRQRIPGIYFISDKEISLAWPKVGSIDRLNKKQIDTNRVLVSIQEKNKHQDTIPDSLTVGLFSRKHESI